MNAIEQAKIHAEELSFLNDALGETLVQLWTAKIKTWENDRSAPNPYYAPTRTGPSETEVRKRLMLIEEQEQAKRGSEEPVRFTRTSFLLLGLDLEREQYVSLLFIKPHADIPRDRKYVH